jgi:hypothetical protein
LLLFRFLQVEAIPCLLESFHLLGHVFPVLRRDFLLNLFEKAGEVLQAADRRAALSAEAATKVIRPPERRLVRDRYGKFD